MEKLIITVTCDSTMSYPDNPYCHNIEDTEWFADEYIRSVNAGASIAHIHGIHHLQDEVQPDGRRLSTIDFEGWEGLHSRIKKKCDVVMQYGIASAKIEDKIKLMDKKPDLMSYCFNSHDEYFQPNKERPPKELLALHPREELRVFLRACNEKNVKPECECFHTGAYFHMQALREEGLIKNPIWCTLFSWPGGSWTPSTPKALLNLVEHLPQNCNFNVSIMNYDVNVNWQMLALTIMIGGHVRVGFEDNPFIKPGVYAKTNAELVEKIVKISDSLGREVANPEEARKIIGI